MWYYFGGKLSLAKKYPLPKKDIIIEPFAGSAQYSLYGDNWKKQVILYDKYEVVTDLWKYLIEKATKEEILALPDMFQGDCIDDVDTCQELRNLIGFCIRRGHPKPYKYADIPFQVIDGKAKGYNSWNYHKYRIAENLYKIKHWKVYNDSYENIENIEATWFIDPPYYTGGHTYAFNNKSIDYNHLAEWCKSRKGQVIVCENTSAEWLDFVPLAKNETLSGKVNIEGMWYNESGNGVNEYNGRNIEEINSKSVKFSFGGF